MFKQLTFNKGHFDVTLCRAISRVPNAGVRAVITNYQLFNVQSILAFRDWRIEYPVVKLNGLVIFQPGYGDRGPGFENTRDNDAFSESFQDVI